MVKKMVELVGRQLHDHDPIQLAWMVKQIFGNA